MTNTTQTMDPTRTGDPIGWFEIGTPDPEGARRFYGEAFGWTFDPQGPYAVITTGEGHPLQGGIQDTREGLRQGTYALPCVLVADTAATVERVVELGGSVVVPVTETPFGLTFAHVADPDGNTIGVFTPPAG